MKLKRILVTLVAVLGLFGTACTEEEAAKVAAVLAQSPPPTQIATTSETVDCCTPEQARWIDVQIWLAAEEAEFQRLYAYWKPMHGCETGGKYTWDTNTGNGYYGGLQFGASDWLAAGGGRFAPRADLARPLQQLQTAEVWKAKHPRGILAWPTCARQEGYV